MSLPNLHSWLLAARPKTLTAAVAPVTVAAALAVRHEPISIGLIILCLICAALLQVATNFINDAADFEKGADNSYRQGPKRAALSGLLSPGALYKGAAVLLFVTLLIGLYLSTVGGLPILIVGLASILAAIAYTAGPFPLAYRGLGDLFVFLFFGLAAVGGTYFLLTGELSDDALLMASAIGLLATSIIAVNNTRDIETDRAANKRTVSVRIGRKAANVYFTGLLLFPFVLWTMVAWPISPLVTLFVFLLLPYSVKICFAFFRAGLGPHFNRLLGATSLHLVLFTFFCSAALIYDALFLT